MLKRPVSLSDKASHLRKALLRSNWATARINFKDFFAADKFLSIPGVAEVKWQPNLQAHNDQAYRSEHTGAVEHCIQSGRYAAVNT